MFALIQAPVILEHRIRRLPIPLGYRNKPFNLVSFAAFLSFCLSCLSSPSVHGWLELENAPPPVTALIGFALSLWEIRYFSLPDVTGFRIPNPAILIGIVLRFPMMGERIFVFPKKRQGKKFSQMIFSNPVNASPVSQVARCRNVQSNWIACSTAAEISWGYFSAVSMIVPMFFSHVSVRSLRQ